MATPLAAFLAIPPAARGEVFYAFAGLDDYWKSVYRYGDDPADFHCSFVIHVWDRPDGSTGVGVVE